MLFRSSVIAMGPDSLRADYLSARQHDVRALLEILMKLKPATAKGTYMKSVYMSSTMSPSVQIDTKTLS